MRTGYEHVLTIDGASGSGKTSLLRGLRRQFQCAAVELGPVVRAAAWLAEARNLSVQDTVAEMARLEAAGRMRIDAVLEEGLAASAVELDGSLLGVETFDGELGPALAATSLDASAMAWIHSLVAEALRGRQAALSAREAAARVCPTAALRIRLEAASAVREARKRRQLLRAGVRATWTDDRSLLGVPDDVHIVLDTTDLTEADVLGVVVRAAEERLRWKLRGPSEASPSLRSNAGL
jgi:cytidylate kinase